LSISLRPVEPGDDDFLYRVYAGTRADEMALVPWDDAQKEAFVRMQFNAQHAHYQTHYPDASYQVILSGGLPVGRLYVDRSPNELHIIDIALLPEHRNAGIGSALLKDLLAEAEQTGVPVGIYVEHFNPARRLYDRLGFSQVADEGIYYRMEWRPATHTG
jgi:ribosomal protein S18 acetylase RimI-like enzyme